MPRPRSPTYSGDTLVIFPALYRDWQRSEVLSIKELGSCERVIGAESFLYP